MTAIAHAAYEEAGHRARGAVLRRGLRPVHRAGAGLVRGHRAVRARARPSSCCASGDTDARWPDTGEPQRWAGLLRRGRSRPRRSRRSASSPGSCAVRPTAARSRAPARVSRSTRACSVTARPSSRPADTDRPECLDSRTPAGRDAGHEIGPEPEPDGTARFQAHRGRRTTALSSLGVEPQGPLRALI